MPDCIDFTPNMESHNCCTRLCCWPCQDTIAMVNACITFDMNGICNIIWCCPCRVFCGTFPTNAEKSNNNNNKNIRNIYQFDEPKEYIYTRKTIYG